MMKDRRCKRSRRAKARRTPMATEPDASRMQFVQDEPAVSAARRAHVFRLNIDVDDIGHSLVEGPVRSGMSIALLQRACWHRPVREELETDGRKRQSLLDSMGQVTVADLLDGAI